ncbi:MAG: decaprenyl-phosphate phosphoribosyltransferase [candidate division KSB1 bacterium]|nr:decaprenyl-phosphate phosphoribosyltransferase [candidate division KSB1 bacterium]
MQTLRYILTTARPRQWVKNVLVFAGLVFARDVFVIDKLSSAIIAFVYFCLVSSSVYLINDVFDRKKDARHPVKKHRPLAAGKLSPVSAIIAALVFMTIALIGGYFYNVYLTVVFAAYLFLNILYSFYLKRIVILDVMIIASGFMFRAVGGTLAINEPISSWFLLCALFLALFLALSKRKAEILSLGKEAGSTRPSLHQYQGQFLDQILTIVTTSCLMSYALYTLDEQTVEKFGNQNLLWTLPFVIYGLFRYVYLVYNKNSGETPETVIFKDRSLFAAILLYILSIFFIIYL